MGPGCQNGISSVTKTDKGKKVKHSGNDEMNVERHYNDPCCQKSGPATSQKWSCILR